MPTSEHQPGTPAGQGIAGHFPAAALRTATGADGDAGRWPTCYPNAISTRCGHPPRDVHHVADQGGALGQQGATVTASGYGSNMHHALVMAELPGRAFGRCCWLYQPAGLIDTQDPTSNSSRLSSAGGSTLVR